MKSLFRLILVLVAPLLAHGAPVNVRDSGATGDGHTKDTAAIQQAIDTSAATGGGEVLVPPGDYLCGSIELKPHVTLNLAPGATIHGSPDAADYPLVNARWEGLMHPCHQALIFAHDAADIAITGSGSILGEEKVGMLRDPRGPTLIEPTSCKNVRIEGVTIGNARVWTVHPTFCQDVTISHVTFASTGGNSDGIDPDSCQRMTIDHCTFSAGDDDIAIKSGKGQEGVDTGKPCEDITVTDCNFLKGHGGVALGSEISGGIRRIKISRCTFGPDVRWALHVKSAPGRGGYCQDVRADHLVVNGCPLLFLETTYHSNADSQPVPGDAGITSFGNITITDVQAASEKTLVSIDATPEKPLDGLTLGNITGSCARPLIIRNARNVALTDIHLTGLPSPWLYTENAQGSGLDGAAPYLGQSAK